MGSIKSAFNFDAYKIDEVTFNMQKIVALLQFKGNIDPAAWKIQIKIRPPLFIKNDKKYIGGIQTSLILESNKEEMKKAVVDDTSKDSKQATLPDYLIKCNVSITGVFSVEKGRLEKEIETTLVKLQIPAILFPYVRSTITSLLANAGFGSIILPLINIHEVAKQSEDLEIQVLD